jgi:hypothetical protein
MGTVSVLSRRPPSVAGRRKRVWLILVVTSESDAESLYFGEIGAIGGGGGGYGPDLPVHEPLLFAPNGTSWETWIPTEFESIEDFISVVGIGDDFVVFHDWNSSTLWTGRPAA